MKAAYKRVSERSCLPYQVLAFYTTEYLLKRKYFFLSILIKEKETLTECKRNTLKCVYMWVYFCLSKCKVYCVCICLLLESCYTDRSTFQKKKNIFLFFLLFFAMHLTSKLLNVMENTSHLLNESNEFDCSIHQFPT